jgi:hypothetical protein
MGRYGELRLEKGKKLIFLVSLERRSFDGSSRARREVETRRRPIVKAEIGSHLDPVSCQTRNLCLTFGFPCGYDRRHPHQSWHYRVIGCSLLVHALLLSSGMSAIGSGQQIPISKNCVIWDGTHPPGSSRPGNLPGKSQQLRPNETCAHRIPRSPKAKAAKSHLGWQSSLHWDRDESLS